MTLTIRPQLSVVASSESFASVWPRLADECGFELVNGAGSDRTEGLVTIVNAAGMEGSLTRILENLEPGKGELLGVGALSDHRIAITALHAGARDYFALPQDYELLKSWLVGYSERIQRQNESATFATSEAAKYRFEGMIGQSPALRETLERAARIIPHGGVTVLINGETGTGKELLARAIHYNGPRKHAPFVDVNCAAIPENLLESELFGHEKGAFTDATATKPGLFEVANGGTIFLDEIAHLSLPLQGKLLRVLEQREIRRVGGNRSFAVDVRVIAATHVDLADAVRQGSFREDLFYRLNVVGLRLPPLRERAGDLLLLARSFLARFAQDYGLPLPAIALSAERCLLAHPWSGNIRELRNTLERAILLAAGDRLEASDLGLEQRPTITSRDQVPFPASMSEIAHAAATAMIHLCDGNKSEASRRLGISRARLLRLLSRKSRELATARDTGV